MNPLARLEMALTGRDLTISVSQGAENRLRLWIERYNAASRAAPGFEPEDLLDPDNDEHLATAIGVCLMDGLAKDEAAHGLYAYDWGEVIAKEQAEEIDRRLR